MELITVYMKQIQLIGGVHFFRVPPNTKKADAMAFIEAWKKDVGEDKPLVIISEHLDVKHEDRFDFPAAMALMKEGRAVCREIEKERNHYWTMESDGRIYIKEDVTKTRVRIFDHEDILDRKWMLYNGEL